MSITPIEEAGDNREPSRDERPGVRGRLRTWLASVGQRLRAVVTPTVRESTTDEEETEQSGAIRVGGQRRLTGASGQSTDETDPPPARGNLPGSAEVDVEENDGTLRVYNPEHEGAFIASDTWEDIEQ